MNPAVRNGLEAIRAPIDVKQDYDLGFYAIGYERRSSFVASQLAARTKKLYGLEYDTAALAIQENRKWAEENGVIRHQPINYRTDEEGHLWSFVDKAIGEIDEGDNEKVIFIDVSSMDRSLLARLLAAVFNILKPPLRLRLCYAPAAYVAPKYVFVPTRECAPAIPELSGTLGIHQSSVSLLLGLGFEYGVSLGLLEQLEPDHAIVFIPRGTDARYDSAVRKANFEFDFGLENVRLIPFQVNQPLAVFESLFSISAEASIAHRVIIAPNGPKILAALAIIVGLFRAPHVTVLRASLASGPPIHHVEADGSIVSIDFRCR
jgi:hypothetical protein